MSNVVKWVVDNVACSVCRLTVFTKTLDKQSANDGYHIEHCIC